MGTGSFPGVKCGRGVLLTTHPLLVPQSWKSRAIPLPTLWATPACNRDYFFNNKFCCVIFQNVKDVFTITLNSEILHRKIIKVSKPFWPSAPWWGQKRLNGCFHSERKKLRSTIVSFQVVPSQFLQKKRGGSSQNNQGRLTRYGFRRLLACQAYRMEHTSFYNERSWTCGGAPRRLCYVGSPTSSSIFWVLPIKHDFVSPSWLAWFGHL